MKVFKRAKAAIAAANGQPFITIRNSGETIYIVGGIERMTEIGVHGDAVRQLRNVLGY